MPLPVTISVMTVELIWADNDVGGDWSGDEDTVNVVDSHLLIGLS